MSGCLATISKILVLQNIGAPTDMQGMSYQRVSYRVVELNISFPVVDGLHRPEVRSTCVT